MLESYRKGLQSISKRVSILESRDQPNWRKPFKLLIYYGTPQGINPDVVGALWDSEKAAQVFAHWDYIVFGAGLELSTSPQHTNTQDIIGLIRGYNPVAKIFGYIDLGVRSIVAPGYTIVSNYAPGVYQSRISNWFDMGVDGIFLDDAGMDWSVSRSRLNNAVDYCHSIGLATFVNAWDPNDIMSNTENDSGWSYNYDTGAWSALPDQALNPGSTATKMDGRDYYLAESFIVNTDSYSATNGYQTMANIITKANLMLSYRVSLGVKMMAINVVNYDGISDFQTEKYFKQCESAAIIFSLDGWGMSALGYSAVAPNADDVVLHNFWDLFPYYINYAIEYWINGGNTIIRRFDINAMCRIDTGSSVYQYQVPGTTEIFTG